MANQTKSSLERYQEIKDKAKVECVGAGYAHTKYRVLENHDPDFPFAELPTAVGGGVSTYYSDYYYQNTGARVARFGGSWHSGLYAGPSCWYLSHSSGGASVSYGGRLLKKPL